VIDVARSIGGSRMRSPEPPVDQLQNGSEVVTAIASLIALSINIRQQSLIHEVIQPVLNQSIGHLSSENYRIAVVVSRCIADTIQPKSVVQYGCGHGLLSPPVRLASNKWRACYVHSVLLP
jgi:hypothetical protein